MRNLLFIMVILLMAVIGASYGQIFPSEYNNPIEYSYDIMPTEEGLFAISVNMEAKEINYFFTDGDLIKYNEGIYTFIECIYKIKYKVKEDKVYILFNWDSGRIYQKIFMIIESATGQVSFLPVQNSLLTYIDDFFVLENTIAMIGYYDDDKSLVQFMDKYDHTQEMSSIYLQVKILDIDDDDGYLDILASSRSINGIHQLVLFTLNEEGQKMYTIVAETQFEPTHIIKSGMLEKIGEDKYIAVGTYSKSNKSHFSGYFYWDIDYTLEQNFTMYPILSLQGFAKDKSKKLNNQIRYELNKGFYIVKVLKENGQLAIMSIPNNGYQYWNKYPRIFDKSLIHILYLNENGEKLTDEIFTYNRTTKSPYVDYNFLINPPLYLVEGNIYFLNNEGLFRNPNLIIHNLRSHEKTAVEDLFPGIPRSPYYRSQQLKNNEIIVYGLRENIFKDKFLFLNKLNFPSEYFR